MALVSPVKLGICGISSCMARPSLPAPSNGVLQPDCVLDPDSLPPLDCVLEGPLVVAFTYSIPLFALPTYHPDLLNV